MENNNIILPHGGYRELKGFQLAQLVYDITVRFVELYINRKSRTCDQMVQAARSGVQNIAEGSCAGATSKKTELKLTNVARASLEELRLDYEDYLRQRNLPQWDKNNPLLVEFKARRINSITEFRDWVKWGRVRTRTNTDQHGLTLNNDVSVSVRPCQSVLVANGALSLLNLACYLLDKQIQRLADDFEKNGGFTENLYRVRKAKQQWKR